MRRETNKYDQLLRYLWIGMLGIGFVVIGIVLLLDNNKGEPRNNVLLSEQLNEHLAMQQSNQENDSTINEIVDHNYLENKTNPTMQDGQLIHEIDNVEGISIDNQYNANREQPINEQPDEQEQSIYDGSEKININTATVEQLQTLKGIGPSKAQAIVDDRNLKGNFKHTEDLKRVKGIGEKLYAGVKESIVAKP